MSINTDYNIINNTNDKNINNNIIDKLNSNEFINDMFDIITHDQCTVYQLCK
jgi:hypothetical protein